MKDGIENNQELIACSLSAQTKELSEDSELTSFRWLTDPDFQACWRPGIDYFTHLIEIFLDGIRNLFLSLSE